jgi:hypothetical protein
MEASQDKLQSNECAVWFTTYLFIITLLQTSSLMIIRCHAIDPLPVVSSINFMLYTLYKRDVSASLLL